MPCARPRSEPLASPPPPSPSPAECKAWVSYAMVGGGVCAWQPLLERLRRLRILQTSPANCPYPTPPPRVQMEKRSVVSSPAEQHNACRAVLQRGLALNPQSTCLIQVGGCAVRLGVAGAPLLSDEACGAAPCAAVQSSRAHTH